jgi:hypothetical protein
MLGAGLKTSGLLLLSLGIAATLFGSFYIRLPGLSKEIKKPVSTWFGRATPRGRLEQES